MPPQKEKKKGFGERLKDVGKAIGREAKKIPGTIYREGIKPEAKRILEKFTEPGPPAERLVGPLKQGTPEQRARARKSLLPAKILTPAEQMSKEAPTIAEQLKKPAASYPLAGGRTSAYNVPVRMIPRPGETMSTPAFIARRQKAQDARDQRKSVTPPRTGEKPTLRRGTQQEKAIRDATSLTTAEPLVDQTRATPKTTARGSVSRYTIRTTAEVPEKAEPPKDKPPTSADRAFTARRRQQAGLEASRKGKPTKRKFSGRKTTAEIGKAARAGAKTIEVDRIDTTAQEVARMMTEQEMAREAQRTETELKDDRTPRREKARYRYRTRGYKRSEGRSR